MSENAATREKVRLSQREIETYREEGLVVPDNRVPPAKSARREKDGAN